MKKPNLPIIILCLAICVSGIAALSLKTFHTVNSTTSPYLLYLKVLQGNQQFYNVESGDYLDIHQLKETITSDNLPSTKFSSNCNSGFCFLKAVIASFLTITTRYAPLFLLGTA